MKQVNYVIISAPVDARLKWAGSWLKIAVPARIAKSLEDAGMIAYCSHAKEVMSVEDWSNNLILANELLKVKDAFVVR